MEFAVGNIFGVEKCSLCVGLPRGLISLSFPLLAVSSHTSYPSSLVLVLPTFVSSLSSSLNSSFSFALLFPSPLSSPVLLLFSPMLFPSSSLLRQRRHHLSPPPLHLLFIFSFSSTPPLLLLLLAGKLAPLNVGGTGGALGVGGGGGALGVGRGGDGAGGALGFWVGRGDCGAIGFGVRRGDCGALGVAAVVSLFSGPFPHRHHPNWTPNVAPIQFCVAATHIVTK